MMQPDGSSARDHIPRANWRSFVPPQIAAILGTTRHCVLLIARGSTAIFSVFCGTDERFCFDPPRDREERCALRSEEHTSEFQSLMRISYAVLCFKKKKNIINRIKHTYNW